MARCIEDGCPNEADRRLLSGLCSDCHKLSEQDEIKDRTDSSTVILTGLSTGNYSNWFDALKAPRRETR